MNGSCYYPTGVFASGGQCASGGMLQDGQCYDTIPQDANTVPCINGYIYGHYELGMCR